MSVATLSLYRLRKKPFGDGFQSLQGAHVRCNALRAMHGYNFEQMFQSLRGAHVRCNNTLHDASCAIAEQFQSLQGAHARCNEKASIRKDGRLKFQSLRGAHVRCNRQLPLMSAASCGGVSIAPWSACPLQRDSGGLSATTRISFNCSVERMPVATR